MMHVVTFWLWAQLTYWGSLYNSYKKNKIKKRSAAEKSPVLIINKRNQSYILFLKTTSDRIDKKI